MKKSIALYLSLISYPILACQINYDHMKADLESSTRTLYGLENDTLIEWVKDIDNVKRSETEKIYVEEVMNEHFFDRPRKDKNVCPDRIVQIVRVYTQDPFRKCHGMIRAEHVGRNFNVLFRDCTTN